MRKKPKVTLKNSFYLTYTNNSPFTLKLLMIDKGCFPLYGIVTVLNTPFTLEGQVDFPSIRKNVQRALKAGVAGFLVPALAAEVNQLSEKEKISMVEAVSEEVDGKVPVFAATGPIPLPDAKKLINSYLSLGFFHRFV